MVAHARWCSCSNCQREPAWSLMPVGVRVRGKDRTWSLMPIGVQYLILWKGYSLFWIYKILWWWSCGSRRPVWEGGVKGGIMSHSRLEPPTFNTYSTLCCVYMDCELVYILESSV